MRRPPSGCTSTGSNEPSSATRARQIVTPRPWSSARAPMCGESARTLIDELPRGAIEVEAPILRRDLGGVGRLAFLFVQHGIGSSSTRASRAAATSAARANTAPASSFA